MLWRPTRWNDDAKEFIEMDTEAAIENWQHEPVTEWECGACHRLTTVTHFRENPTTGVMEHTWPCKLSPQDRHR